MLNLKASEARRAADYFVEEITRLAVKPIRLMEVCGTHTVAIFKAGIRQLLPEQVELISGPGCPVCVTPSRFIDKAIAYSRQPDVIIATFGDMLRVPGSSASLMREKAQGADIRTLYSPLDSIALARENQEKKIIFLAVGFETTAPAIAATVLAAASAGLTNFYILSAHKLVPPALKALLDSPGSKIDGFLLPGHVSAVIGTAPYQFIGGQYGLPAVVAGFEAVDILQSVYLLVQQIAAGTAGLINQYARVVKPAGNAVAQEAVKQVFDTADSEWRGLGNIANSGLTVNRRYSRFDASLLPVAVEETDVDPGCRCGEILRGSLRPADCPLFGKRCLPENPIGPCMVSVEGTCAAWYKYGSGRWQI